MSGGTDNHLMLVDLIGKDYTGKDADAALGRPISPSTRTLCQMTRARPLSRLACGLAHLPSPLAVLARRRPLELTGWMCDVLESLENGNSDEVVASVKTKVLEICARFPVYRD